MCLFFPEKGFPAGPPLRPLARGTGRAPSRRLPRPDTSLLDRMQPDPAFFAVPLPGDCPVAPTPFLLRGALGATRRAQAPSLRPQPQDPAASGLPAPPSALQVYYGVMRSPASSPSQSLSRKRYDPSLPAHPSGPLSPSRQLGCGRGPQYSTLCSEFCCQFMVYCYNCHKI